MSAKKFVFIVKESGMQYIIETESAVFASNKIYLDAQSFVVATDNSTFSLLDF